MPLLAARKSSYVYPDNSLTEFGMTASVFHSAALCGVEMGDTLAWLKHNMLKNRGDIACMALGARYPMFALI